jgi:hypothetical protein
MDPWEQLGLNVAGGLAQAGLNFGQAYAGYWLDTQQLESYLELQSQYAPRVVAPALNIPLLLILVVGFVFVAKR